MSKREVRALREALVGDLPIRPISRLRSGRGRRTRMADEASGNPRVSPGEGVQISETVETARGEDGTSPEMETRGGSSSTEVHQLLEQVARLRELLTGKEAELAEVKSELTFARGDAETARQDAETTRNTAAVASREVEAMREQLEESDRQLEDLQKQQQTVTMEFELKLLRDRETLRQEFDAERKQIREAHEHEMQEVREWRKEIITEKNRLRDHVKRLEECQRRVRDPITVCEPCTATEIDTGMISLNVTDKQQSQNEQSQQETTTQHSKEDSPPSVELTASNTATIPTVHFQLDNEGSSSPTPSVVTGDQAASSPGATNPSNEESKERGDGPKGGSEGAGIMSSVTRLLEAQRHIMEAQAQAMAAQSVPPLRKFSGESTNTDEGSVDRWIEQFEERARVTGWNETQKLFQLKAHLEKMAEHTVRMLPSEEKISYDKVVCALKKRFCSVDIEELRGLEFHQLMQASKQTVEELGVELQKLGRKAFPTSDAKEFDRIVKGRFYQALLPKWQRKLGAPKATETFDELFARACTLERHEQQFASCRGESRTKEPHSKNSDQTNSQPQSQTGTGAGASSPKDTTPKTRPSQPARTSGRSRGCFNCGDLNHLRRDCPNFKPESSRRSGVGDLSTKSSGQDTISPSPGAELGNPTPEEESVHQLEKVLATMRLNLEKSKLQKSNVETVVADQVSSVGPVIYLEVELEGCPVKAVVDTGAQSTIISRDQLHRIAKTMKESGRDAPTLEAPSAKLYGRSGSGRSELTITAETQLQVTVDSRRATVPIFVQPGSDIPCLLGTNVLPLLGVKLLRANGVPLLKSAENPSVSPQTPEAVTVELNPPRMDPLTVNAGESNAESENAEESSLPVEAEVRIVRSTFLPPRTEEVLEVEVATGLPNTENLLFEPYRCSSSDGLEIAEAVMSPNQCGKLFIPVENHSSLSQSLTPGTSIGRVTPLPSTSSEVLELTVLDSDVLSKKTMEIDSKLSTPSPPYAETNQDFPTTNGAKRLETLFQLLSLENEVTTPEQTESLKQLIAANADVFALSDDELGHSDLVQHHVDTGSSPPIKQPVRRVPFFYRDKIANMVERMEQLGVIRKSGSAWSSPVVLIPKKDGSYRFCVDYRKLNSVTNKDVYPLPRIDDILDTLSGARYFSTLDLASGYWQIELDPSTSAKSAFVTHQGLHEFVRMPFGMCNAPATFQRLMEVVLAGLLWKNCFVYIDDVLVCSNTFEEHLVHLTEVLSRLREAGLRLKAKKCMFLREEVCYLGHVVSSQGIKPDTAKTEKIREYPAPKDVNEVRQFLGLASYYRRFVAEFAKIASPLHFLLKKDVEFQWSPECSTAFQNLKEALVNAPVLAYPRFNSADPFMLETDASTRGLGAVLAQQQPDGKVHPIAFASRSLTTAEKNYAITELETLGLVWAVKTFRPYILGRRCIVFTDHAACTALLSSKHLSSKLVRWAMTIQELDLDIRHRAGRSNRVADALSRNPVEVAHVLQFQSTEFSEEEAMPEQLVPATTAKPHVALDVPANLEADIKELQRQDSQLTPIIDYHEKGVLPADEKSARRLVMETELYELVDDVLFFISPSNPHTPRLAVPDCLKKTLIKEHHDGKFAGHFAERKIYATMKTRYWWKGMRSDIPTFCRSCLVCVSRKGAGHKKKPPLQPIPVGGPFEMVGVDVLQLPLSRNGNQYAVVFQDYLTKWPEAFATPDQKAETIARLLVEHVVVRHGVPECLLSDRGPNFLSELMREVCRLLGTTKVNTSGYHPQCDGLVEKLNNTLISMLAKSVNKYGHDWDVQLPYVLFAYRAAVQDSTQISPFHMLYGREPVLPCEQTVTQPKTKYQVDLQDYTDELTAYMSDAWSFARDNIQKAQRKQKQQYDRKSKLLDLKVGDRVMVYFPNVVRGKAWKFARPFYGPYVMVSLTPTNVEVRLVDRPSDNTIFVALDRVRPCYAQMTNDVWVGHGARKTTNLTRKRKEVPVSDAGQSPYTGPVTRSRTQTTRH